jgi:hypothetical protein
MGQGSTNLSSASTTWNEAESRDPRASSAAGPAPTPGRKISVQLVRPRDGRLAHG